MADAALTDTTTWAPTAEALLGVVDAALRELNAGAPGVPAVSLQSRLDHDLGLDSLARMELVLRAERAFGVELPQDTLQRAETVADLLKAVQQCAAATGRPCRAQRATGYVLNTAASVEDTAVAGPGVAAATTLPGVLDWHLQVHPEQTQIVLLHDDVEQTLSYRQLADAASAFAAGLQRAGVGPRQCVAIMLPTSAEYFSTYLGILKAGAIPVPIYPPARASQLEDHVLRHAGILDNAQAVLLVTVPEALGVARLLQARVPGLRRVATAQRTGRGRNAIRQRWRCVATTSPSSSTPRAAPARPRAWR